VKKEARRVFQLKAVSPNPKNFWQTFNFAMGRFNSPITEITVDGKTISDPKEVAERFADFFGDKVKSLCHGDIQASDIDKPLRPLKISMVELRNSLRSLSNKKSFGVDGVPQNVFKGAMKVMDRQMLKILNQFCKNGMDESLKVARVIPLHKKGDKTLVNNYRPVSNLSVFSKVYEKCLLNKLEAELGGFEGEHQHAYRKGHSTETALLNIQAMIAEALDGKKPAILYSVDLSAALDLLKPDIFEKMFKDKMSQGLLFAILDFLSNRKFVVEVENQRSKVVSLDRGCVQGSILGPKLFTLYMYQLASIIPDAKVVTYADDSYVFITGNSAQEVITNAKSCFLKHVDYLTKIGMVVNQQKTEVLWIGKDRPSDTIDLNGNVLNFADEIKALGIYINGNLCWDKQAEFAINKGKKLVSSFKFLRKYLTKDQFLKAASAHFYGAVFYASSVWFERCKGRFKTRFKSLHFRLLRTACKDYGLNRSKAELTKICKRATPEEWAKFATASKVTKIMRDEQPKPLFTLLQRTLFVEQRRCGFGKFFDGSKTTKGHQALQNRLACMKEIIEPWLDQELNDDEIRILMKKSFFNYLKI